MTDMLEKYRENFSRLTADQATRLAEAMHLPDALFLTGTDIYEIAEEAGLDQADVVMSLATDTTVDGIHAVEVLVGKPIVRRRPETAAPPGSSPTAPRRRQAPAKRSDPRKITFVVDANPKKPGSASHARFALYRVGMTIDEFLSAGGTLGDVNWDLERGFIQLEGGV